MAVLLLVLQSSSVHSAATLLSIFTSHRSHQLCHVLPMTRCASDSTGTEAKLERNCSPMRVLSSLASYSSTERAPFSLRLTQGSQVYSESGWGLLGGKCSPHAEEHPCPCLQQPACTWDRDQQVPSFHTRSCEEVTHFLGHIDFLF